MSFLVPIVEPEACHAPHSTVQIMIPRPLERWFDRTCTALVFPEQGVPDYRAASCSNQSKWTNLHLLIYQKRDVATSSWAVHGNAILGVCARSGYTSAHLFRHP